MRFHQLLVGLVVMGVLQGAEASRPVAVTHEVCILDGLLIEKENSFVLRPQGELTPLEVMQYEGLHLEVAGDLLPGDTLIVSKVQVLGPCDDTLRAALFKKTFHISYAYHDRARWHLAAQRWDQALVDVDKALALDADSCSFLMTRAQARAGKGQLAAAVTDADRSIGLGCARYDEHPINYTKLRATIRALAKQKSAGKK